MLLTDLVAKELEIFKEAVPQAMRIGVLWNPTTPSHRPPMQAVEAAGEKLGVQLVMVPARTVEDLDGAFATMTRERVNGFLVVASNLSVSQRALLAELALKHRLPGMFGTRENVEAGGFMSYAPDLRDLTRRAATYIDKILKGAKPADLPVEQATKFELMVNNKTAQLRLAKVDRTKPWSRIGQGDTWPPTHFIWRKHHAVTSRPVGAVSRRSCHKTRPCNIRASGTAKVGTITSG